MFYIIWVFSLFFCLIFYGSFGKIIFDDGYAEGYKSVLSFRGKGEKFCREGDERMGEPEKKYNPTGSAQDPYDKNSYGMFQSMLYNLPYQRDQATKRNKIYLALIAILIVAMVFIAMTANFKTYVVRVDSTSGRIEAGQEVKATAYSPREAEIKYFLMDFIKNTRQIPLDPIMYRNNWATAQHYMTKEASAKMAILVQQENQAARVGTETVEIVIRTVQQQPGSTNLYQMRWDETTFKQMGSGIQQNTARYVGLFSFAVIPPTDEKELSINPLGLMITDLNIAKEADLGRSE